MSTLLQNEMIAYKHIFFQFQGLPLRIAFAEMDGEQPAAAESFVPATSPLKPEAGPNAAS